MEVDAVISGKVQAREQEKLKTLTGFSCGNDTLFHPQAARVARLLGLFKRRVLSLYFSKDARQECRTSWVRRTPGCDMTSSSTARLR